MSVKKLKGVPSCNVGDCTAVIFLIRAVPDVPTEAGIVGIMCLGNSCGLSTKAVNDINAEVSYFRSRCYGKNTMKSNVTYMSIISKHGWSLLQKQNRPV
jgi:hypothetical protein